MTERYPKVITSPAALRWSFYDQPTFLAGGISGCPEWQLELIELLRAKESFRVLLNPRRAEGLELTGDGARAQMEWEQKAMSSAKDLVFWFCKETIQPIVLFELGKYCESDKDLFVGIAPGYPREFDVREQLRIARSWESREPVSSLEDLAAIL